MSIKAENLNCRISPEHKKMIEMAANISGFSLSEYIVHTLVSAASDTIQNESIIKLTKDEWDRFTSSLNAPAKEPSEDIKKAVELFNKGHDEGDSYKW